MKKIDILNLYKAILTMENRKFNAAFSYFLAKTKIALKDEVEILESLGKNTLEFEEYDIKRTELARQNSEKNKDGTPIIQNNNFVITTNLDLFQENLEKLKKEYNDTLEERTETIEDLNILLDEQSEFTSDKIDIKFIPDDIEPIIIEMLIIAKLIIE